MGTKTVDLSKLSGIQQMLVGPMLNLDYKKRITASKSLSSFGSEPSTQKNVSKDKQLVSQHDFSLNWLPKYFSQTEMKTRYRHTNGLILFFYFYIIGLFSFGVILFYSLYLWNAKYLRKLTEDLRCRFQRRLLFSTMPIFGPFYGFNTNRHDGKKYTFLTVLPFITLLAGVFGFGIFENRLEQIFYEYRIDIIFVAPIIYAPSIITSGITTIISIRREFLPHQNQKAKTKRAFKQDATGKPIIPVTWDDVTVEFFTILQGVKRERFVIDVETKEMKGIFFQGYFEPDRSVTVECAADLSLQPKVTTGQLDNLQKLGWQPPNQGVPNFSRFLTLSESNPEFIAEFFSETLQKGYGISPNGIKLK
jgi:hypothetical protein